MRTLILSGLLAGTALLAGCASNTATPRPLKVAVNDIYCTQTACSCVHEVAARDYADTLEKLKNESGIELHFDYFIEPYELEDAILSGQYDGVICKPWIALRLQKEAGADFRRIVDLPDPGDNRWLTGIVIVPANSPITKLQDLTGKRIYLGQEDAYEKHYAAQRLLADNDITPGVIGYNASCSENIGVLLDGEADAAVVSDYALSADCAVDFANPDDFRTLAHTEMIPLTSLMVDMRKISETQAKELRQALLALSGTDVPTSLLSKGFVEPWPWIPPELDIGQ